MVKSFEKELDKFESQLLVDDNTDTQLREIEEQVQQHRANLVKFPKNSKLYDSCISQLMIQKQEIIAAAQKMPDQMERATKTVEFLTINLQREFTRAASDLNNIGKATEPQQLNEGESSEDPQDKVPQLKQRVQPQWGAHFAKFSDNEDE